MCKREWGLCWLPFVVSLLMVTCFVATYIMAVVFDDVTEVFPYISDTGGNAPESSVFTFLLSLSGYAAAILIYVRYKQILEYNKEDIYRVLAMNKYSLYMGIISCLGVIVVSAFQDTDVITVHLIGAGMAFVGGLIYMGIASKISLRLRVPSRLAWTRILITTVCFIALILTLVNAYIANKEEPSMEDMEHKHPNCTVRPFPHYTRRPWPGYWKPCMAGYVYHVVSAVSEWTMALSFLVFFLTYVGDLRKITMETYVRLNMYHDYLEIHNERSTLNGFS